MNKECTALEFTKGDYPNVLYKYRNFEDHRHLSILTDQEVFFSAPSCFEDPLDCKVPVRPELLENNQILELYEYHSRMQFPRLTRRHHKRNAREWKSKGLLKNRERLKKLRDEDLTAYDKRVGILSLTANQISEPMWVKYASNHTGFAVGFYAECLFNFVGGGGIVRYCESLPIILPRPFHSFEQQIHMRAFFKQMQWSFEEEAANVGSIISEHASFNGVSEAINEGKFSGAFTLSSSIGAVSFRVEASKLVDTEVKTSSRGRSAECYTARDVLACAGRSIDRMGPFSYTACLIDMPICVLIEMADCAYGGCQW